jgi:hypothetical protein
VIAVVLSVLIALIVAPIARNDLARGRVTRWSPRSKAAIFFGQLPADTLWLGGAAMVFVPLALGLLQSARVESPSLSHFIMFKATFAAFLAALVTPIVAGRPLTPCRAPN